MTDEVDDHGIGPCAADGRTRGLQCLSRERAGAFRGLLRAGETLAREVDAELIRAHSIGLHAFEMLLFLGVSCPQGHSRLAALVQRTPLSQSRVSRLVAELGTRGLVHRSSAANDRRAVRVSITTAGVETVRAAQDAYLSALQRRLFARLTPEETCQLATLTAKILDDRHLGQGER